MRNAGRCIGWAIVLHLVAGTILAFAWVVLIAGSSAFTLAASAFVDVPTLDPLAPAVGGLARLWAAGISAAVAGALGFVIIGLGWMWIKVFWRLGHSLAAVGLRCKAT
jgi:hypothetical protein